MIMEVASDTKGEVPETPGTTWESQRKLPRDIRGRILQAKERERPDFQAKGRNAFFLIYSCAKYVVEPLCGQGMVLVAGDIAANEREKNSCPCGAYMGRRTLNKRSKQYVRRHE